MCRCEEHRAVRRGTDEQRKRVKEAGAVEQRGKAARASLERLSSSDSGKATENNLEGSKLAECGGARYACRGEMQSAYKGVSSGSE